MRTSDGIFANYRGYYGVKFLKITWSLALLGYRINAIALYTTPPNLDAAMAKSLPCTNSLNYKSLNNILFEEFSLCD